MGICLAKIVTCATCAMPSTINLYTHSDNFLWQQIDRCWTFHLPSACKLQQQQHYCPLPTMKGEKQMNGLAIEHTANNIMMNRKSLKQQYNNIGWYMASTRSCYHCHRVSAGPPPPSTVHFNIVPFRSSNNLILIYSSNPVIPQIV